MNRTGFVLAILVLAALLGPGSTRAQDEEPAPQPQMIGSIPPVGVGLPDFHWNTMSGGSFTSEDLRDHRTVMLLWSPSCPGSKSVVEDLPALLETINDAGARLFIVNADSSRVEARKALSGAIPESQVVFARRVSEVLTNPAAYEGVEGPVLKAVVIPAVVLIDPQGIVRSSRLWNGIAEVSAELERIAQGIAIDTPAREWVSHSASHSR